MDTKVKINKYCILIFFLIFLDLDCFALIDLNKFNIAGIKLVDITFFIHILICIIELMKNNFKIYRGIPFIITLLVLGLTLTSAVAGCMTYSQELYLGIVSLRSWFSVILLIYPLYSWIQKDFIKVREIEKILLVVGFIYSIIGILQYFLYNHIVFTYTTHNERYGSLRLYFDTIYISFISGIIINKLLNKENKKSVFLICYLFMIFFMLVIVTKGRMMVITTISSIVFCLLFKSNINTLKKSFIIVLMLIMLVVFFNTTMGEDILNTIFGKTKENDTLSVRNSGREYYLNLVFQSPITVLIGCGSPNIHNEVAQKITNPLWNKYGTARFYLSDQGIIGNIFEFGLLGAITYIGITIYLIKQSILMLRIKNKSYYFQFILTDLIGIITLIPMLFQTSLIFVIFICMMLGEKKELQKEQDYVMCNDNFKL